MKSLNNILMKSSISIVLVYLLLSCSQWQDKSESRFEIEHKESLAPIEIVSAKNIDWGPLNPARGENGPKAGNLWGDRNSDQASGFLVQFVDGFSSPPHIHNITYRGIAISGTVHNDDPEAKKMWMPAGSFWTQPVGEPHITSAWGPENIVYVEIDKGPYLVKPVEEAFDSGEQPINLVPSNMVWMDGSDITWIDPSISSGPMNPSIAFLWGNPNDGGLTGALVKLPVGFKGKIYSNEKGIKAVIIKGKASIHLRDEEKPLESGNYFGSLGRSVFNISNKTTKESIIYLRSEGSFSIRL
ncbi:MAG: DUF4437 domain-containing protein [Bacteroidota bacterium]